MSLFKRWVIAIGLATTFLGSIAAQARADDAADFQRLKKQCDEQAAAGNLRKRTQPRPGCGNSPKENCPVRQRRD